MKKGKRVARVLFWLIFAALIAALEAQLNITYAPQQKQILQLALRHQIVVIIPIIHVALIGGFRQQRVAVLLRVEVAGRLGQDVHNQGPQRVAAALDVVDRHGVAAHHDAVCEAGVGQLKQKCVSAVGHQHRRKGVARQVNRGHLAAKLPKLRLRLAARKGARKRAQSH